MALSESDTEYFSDSSAENTFSSTNISNSDIVDATVPSASAFNPEDVPISTQSTIAPTTPVLVNVEVTPAPEEPVPVPVQPPKFELRPRPNESSLHFQIRSRYTKLSQEAFPGLDLQTALIIGSMASDRVFLGVSYPKQVQDIINRLNQSISTT